MTILPGTELYLPQAVALVFIYRSYFSVCSEYS